MAANGRYECDDTKCMHVNIGLHNVYARMVSDMFKRLPTRLFFGKPHKSGRFLFHCVRIFFRHFVF